MVVLVVDDDELIRQALTLLLKRHCSVATADSAEEALRMLSDGLLPGAIFVDANLHSMTGFEFRDRVGGDPRWSAVPIVLMTAEDLPPNLTELGFVAGLTKPFSSEELLTLIARFDC